jgi:hypothetical protein
VIFPLAYADNFDASNSNFTFVLMCGAAVAGIGLLTGLVILLGRRSAHPHSPQIDAAAILWGIITLGSIIYAASAQLAWAKQHYQDFASGYGDPRDAAPAYPWGLWCALAAIYLVILGWSGWKKA